MVPDFPLLFENAEMVGCLMVSQSENSNQCRKMDSLIGGQDSDDSAPLEFSTMVFSSGSNHECQPPPESLREGVAEGLCLNEGGTHD